MRPTLRDHQRIQRLLTRPGGWSIPQLRSSLCALLARDEDQQTLFLRRFDQFFARQHGAGKVDAEHVAQLREGLGRLAEQPESPAPAAPRPSAPEPYDAPTPQSPQPPPPGRRSGRWALAGLLVLAGALVLWIALSARHTGDDSREEATATEQEAPQDPSTQEETTGSQSTDRRRRNDPAPRLVEVSRSSVAEIQDLPWTSALAGGSLATTLLYVVWLIRRRPPQEPPTWNPEGPRFFDSGAVGPPPEPWLDHDTLDRLADSLGFFAAPQASHRLDLEGSVRATAHHGGEPHLVFEPRRRVHRVLILHDLQSEALEWNPVPRELARGLERRGVPVVEGWFSGAPTSLRTADGGTFHLDDLEDQRQNHLVLIFGDALGLDLQRQRLVLEDLARWPMLAWFEPREPGLWRPVMARLAESGIRCFPATAEALRSAFDQLVGERGVGRERLLPSRIGRLEGRSRAPLPQQVEQILGDALPWAEACALLEPPVGLGLVDALRRFVSPDLPRARLGRLLTLPGSELRNGCLHLAPEVRRVLRSGFEERNSPTQRESVVDFLLEQLETAEPAESESLQHLAWAWRYERLRFENDPEAALETLVGLRRGPHGTRVRESLLGPGGSAEVGPTIEPRLTTARSRALWRQLGSDRPSGLPLPRWQFAILIALMVATGVSLGYFGDDLITAQYYSGRTSDVVVENTTDETVWIGGRLPGSSVEHLTPLAPGEVWEWFVDDLTEQVIEVHGLFHQDSWVVEAAVAIVIEMRVEADTRLSPCFEELGPNLRVQRCPPLAEGESADGLVTVGRWIDAVGVEHAGDLRSTVALEITGRPTGERSVAIERLWQTGAVDAVYEIPLPRDAPDVSALVQALEPTLQEFHRKRLADAVPTQVLWWLDLTEMRSTIARHVFALEPSFALLNQHEALVYNAFAPNPSDVPQLAVLPDAWYTLMADLAEGNRLARARTGGPDPRIVDALLTGTFDGTNTVGLPTDGGDAVPPAPEQLDDPEASDTLESETTARLEVSVFVVESTPTRASARNLKPIQDLLDAPLYPENPTSRYLPHSFESLVLQARIQSVDTLSLATAEGQTASFFRNRQWDSFGETLDDTPEGPGPWTYLAIRTVPGKAVAEGCQPGPGVDRVECVSLSGEITVHRNEIPRLGSPATNMLGQVRLILDNEERLTFCPPGSTMELSHLASRPLTAVNATSENAVFIDTPELSSPWTYRLELRAPSGELCEIQEQRAIPRLDAIRIIVQEKFPYDAMTRLELADLYFGRNETQEPIRPVDQEIDDPLRETFSEEILGLDPKSVETFWQRKLLSGTAVPPEVTTEDEVIQHVLENPGGLGYIATSTPLPEGIKALHIADQEAAQ